MEITNYTYILRLRIMGIMAKYVLKNEGCYTFTDYGIHIKTRGNLQPL